jgi:hypothetical protein
MTERCDISLRDIKLRRVMHSTPGAGSAATNKNKQVKIDPRLALSSSFLVSYSFRVQCGVLARQEKATESGENLGNCGFSASGSQLRLRLVT